MPGKTKLSFKSYFNALSWSVSGLYESSPTSSLFLALFSIFNGLIPAILTIATGKFVQHLNTGEANAIALDQALLWLIVALCITFAGSVIELVTEYLKSCMADNLTIFMQKQLYQHANKMDLAFFEDNESLDKTFRVGKGSGANSILGPVQSAIDGCVGLIQAVSLVGIMMYYALVPSLLMMLAAFPIVFIQIMTVKQNYELHIQSTRRQRWGSYFTSLLTNHESITLIKILNISKLLLDNFLEITTGINREKKQLYQWKLKFVTIAQSIFFITFSSVLIWMVFRIKSGSLTATAFIIFGLAAFRARTSFLRTVKTTLGAVNSTFIVNNIIEFLETSPAILSYGDKTIRVQDKNIEIKNISFGYPRAGITVIDDVSLLIPQGQTIALVGQNGAGKSTFIKLLCRLYAVDKGSICIGGHDIKEIDTEALYRMFSIVTQHPVRFEATVKDNIAYGNWEKIKNNPQRIEKALESVDLTAYAQSLPKGLDTLIGKKFGDHTPSGGQWQKLAIARALTRESSILILDEPTSSLDPIAEQKIFQFIYDITKNRTLFFVTHKFSTAKIADRILVMDKGKIIEDGTHDQLIEAGGMYKRMHNSYFCV